MGGNGMAMRVLLVSIGLLLRAMDQVALKNYLKV